VESVSAAWASVFDRFLTGPVHKAKNRVSAATVTARSNRGLGGIKMSATDEAIRNNEAYARSFDKGGLPLPPAKKLAVLACMDARLQVSKTLGLKEGDAHVIRNAGGVVTEDAIRSLAISQRLLGTEEIILIHHADCGMLTFKDDVVKAQIENETGIRPPFALEAFPNLEDDVRQSIARLKASPFIPKKDKIRGFIYDVKTGRLNEVGARLEARVR
jgi:carbonic anhydrase